LFGSYSRGDDTEKSDIDIAIIGKEKRIDLEMYEKLLEKTIFLHFYDSLDKIDKNLIENTNDWHIIEKQINKETKWLEENILIMPESYRRSPDIIKCTDCLFRKIAIFIVNGKISAIEYSTTINNGLWGDKNETKDNISESITYHGKEWHRKTISVIYNYFKNKAYDILKEPLLSYGRADLGFFDPLINKMVYIEVGTVSLYKIWFNLINMKNIILLIVPSDNKLIKFIN